MSENLRADLPMKRKTGSTRPLTIGAHRLAAVRAIIKKTLRDAVVKRRVLLTPIDLLLVDVMKRVLEAIAANGLVVVTATNDQGVRETMNGTTTTVRNLRAVHADLIVNRTAGIQRAIERRALARAVAARATQFIRARSVPAMDAHLIMLTIARKFADMKIVHAVDQSVRRSAVATGLAVLSRRYM